jgi:hypothetical protein
MYRRRLLALLGAVVGAGCTTDESATPTQTRTDTATPTATATSTASPTATDSPTPSPTPTATASPTPTATASPTATATPTETPLPEMFLSYTPSLQDTETSYTISVDYNDAVTEAVDGGDRTYTASPGRKFAVLQMEVTNRGVDEMPCAPELFELSVDGAIFAPERFVGLPATLDATISGGGTLSGWVAYLVPADATEGKIQLDAAAIGATDPVSATFQRDEDLAIPIVE